MRWERFKAVTFDCYGTLIDWETGILRAVRRLSRRSTVAVSDEQVLAWFAAAESAAEKGSYRTYATVLAEVTATMAQRLQVSLGPGEEGLLADSLAEWPAFADTAVSLQALQRRYRIGILSNVDDALFDATLPRLGVELDWVVTAQQVGSYKPDPRNFARLLEVVGLPPQSVLHVAQSRYHDIAPAKRAGLATVWIDRRAGHTGAGATPAADAVPDRRYTSLAQLVEAMGLND